MKYVVRAFALSLVFASAMIAQPNSNATVSSNASAKHLIFAGGPTPTCTPSDPSCWPSLQ